MHNRKNWSTSSKALLPRAVTALLFGLLVAGCSERPYEVIPTPENIVSLAGELITIRTAKHANQGSAIQIELPMTSRGKDAAARASIYALDGASLRWIGSEPTSGDRVAFTGEPDSAYVIQPEIPDLVANYDFLCRLRWRRQWQRGFRVDPICERILCADGPLSWESATTAAAGALDGLNPEGDLAELGGFGGGSICDRCTRIVNDDLWQLPTPDCAGGTGHPSSCRGDIIFASRGGVFASHGTDSRIFRQTLPGGEPTPLFEEDSNSRSVADVSEDGSSLLFASSGPAGIGAFTVDPAGGEAVQHTAVPSGFSRGRWSRNGSRVFAFNADSPIHLFDTEDELFEPNPLQATFADGSQLDSGGFDFLTSKLLVFSRRDSESAPADLFVADAFEADTPPENVTASADRSESFPVVSHNERLLAFRSVESATGVETLKVVALEDATLGELQHQISLGDNFTGVARIEFTADDRCLLVVAEDNSVDAEIPANRREILLINLQTQLIEKISDNTVDEQGAVAIP